jgi:hypothetical protein
MCTKAKHVLPVILREESKKMRGTRGIERVYLDVRP